MKNVGRYVAPILVLMLGAGVAVVLIVTKPEAPRTTLEPLPPQVEVLQLRQESRVAEIEALGTLQPAREVRIQAEVSGVVRRVAPAIVPGGRVSAGDVLVRLDQRNYRSAVEQQEASLARAQFELEMERARKLVAEREWGLLEGAATLGEANKDLALRKPHLKLAQAELEAAKSALEKAHIDLRRTVLRAPFDALVREESVETGQLVQANASIMTLVGTEAYWVQVTLPVSSLAFVQLPDSKGQGGSRVLVRQSLGGDRAVEKEGHVMRVLGDIDPKGKMARVLVEVKDPLEAGDGFSFLLGSVVSVRIEGATLDGVYVLPRLALHEDQVVWLVDDDHTLTLRHVEVVHRTRNEVFVRGLPRPTASVLTSRLPAPVAGMPVRVSGSATTAEVR